MYIANFSRPAAGVSRQTAAKTLDTPQFYMIKLAPFGYKL
jgi:hypothetical protein